MLQSSHGTHCQIIHPPASLLQRQALRLCDLGPVHPVAGGPAGHPGMVLGARQIRLLYPAYRRDGPHRCQHARPGPLQPVGPAHRPDRAQDRGDIPAEPQSPVPRLRPADPGLGPIPSHHPGRGEVHGAEVRRGVSRI